MQRRLLLLGARHALPCKDLVLAAGKPEFARSISFSSALRKDQNEGKSGWLPQWLQSKLPSALGGTREYDELEELTFDGMVQLLASRMARRGLATRQHKGASDSTRISSGMSALYTKCQHQYSFARHFLSVSADTTLLADCNALRRVRCAVPLHHVESWYLEQQRHTPRATSCAFSGAGLPWHCSC